MTRDEFVLLHPEFGTAASSTVTRVLAEVELEVGDTWGDERSKVVALEACCRLAMSPAGRAARLAAKDGSSTYSVRLQRLKTRLACCNLRIG